MTVGRLLVGALLLASIAPAIAAAPARADDEIALSADGATWGDALSSPLFDRARSWVPGDAETRSFHVRNDGPSDARLQISVVTVDDGRLVSNDDVALSARAARGPWTTLDNGQDASRLVRTALAQGRSVRIDVRAVFGWASSNQSMRDALPLRLVVTLAQDGPIAGIGDRPDSPLPDTGSAVPRWLVTLGVLLVVAGVVLLVLRRRQETADV